MSDISSAIEEFMKFLKLIDEYLEMGICVTLISVIAVVLGLQVFMRYVMQNSLSWSEELARYLFIWLIYIGISYGAKIMRHIKIDASLYLFPKKWRAYVVIIGDFLFLVFCFIVIIYSVLLVNRQLMLSQTSPAIGMPMWIVYAAPGVGFFLTAIRQIQTIIYRLKKIKENKNYDPSEELNI